MSHPASGVQGLDPGVQMQAPAPSATAAVAAGLPGPQKCLRWQNVIIRELNGTRAGIKKRTGITV